MLGTNLPWEMRSSLILIHAGGGGVGHLALQLAKLKGAKVITTAASEASIKLVKELGAEHLINYKKDDFVSAELTEGKGVLPFLTASLAELSMTPWTL